jgi:hypothetical protein
MCFRRNGTHLRNSRQFVAKQKRAFEDEVMRLLDWAVCLIQPDVCR